MADPELEPVGPAASADELFDPLGKIRRQADGSHRVLDAIPSSTDRDALKRKALSDKERELQAENDMRAVLATESGVRTMARIIWACGWNAPFYTHETNEMCNIAGRRQIAWQLEQWISDAELSLWFKVRAELEHQRAKPKTSGRAATAR